MNDLIRNLKRLDKFFIAKLRKPRHDDKYYLSIRGKIFKGNHVYSIVKEKRLKDEKLERENLEVHSNFIFRGFDKSLVNIFDGL